MSERSDQVARVGDLSELKQMTSEMLGSMRALAPLPDALKTHTEKIDLAVGALDGRLDQLERAHIKIEATLEMLATHEERIKSLEDDRTRLKAWAALIAFLASIGAFVVGKLWPK